MFKHFEKVSYLVKDAVQVLRKPRVIFKVGFKSSQGLIYLSIYFQWRGWVELTCRHALWTSVFRPAVCHCLAFALPAYTWAEGGGGGNWGLERGCEPNPAILLPCQWSLSYFRTWILLLFDKNPSTYVNIPYASYQMLAKQAWGQVAPESPVLSATDSVSTPLLSLQKSYEHMAKIRTAREAPSECNCPAGKTDLI